MFYAVRMKRRTMLASLPVLAAACTMHQPARAQPPAPVPAAPVGPVAPAIRSAAWLNTNPIDWQRLRGTVVMVEFWTLGCINCQNVIPAMKQFHDDYKAKGFTLIGVHSPEFEYEKKLSNVQAAIKKWGIAYPVAIDNDFANWRRYHNRYWPALYLIDKRGVIRHTRAGEGGESETRKWIEALLAEKA
jgi:thiol-disulfide isomerase/thioredoxin